LTTTPAAIGTTETVAYQFQVPAGGFVSGSTWRIRVYGTMTATLNPAMSAKLRIGALGTTADQQVVAGPSINVSSGSAWAVDAFFTVRSSGSSGTVLGNVLMDSAPAGSTQSSAVALNTTQSNWVSVTVTGGGTGPAVTVLNAFAQQVR
jgi:hypothetical protein